MKCSSQVIVDIFSGAGGMSVGACMAGFEPNLAVELDKHAAATYQKNHPNTKVLQKDIKDIVPTNHVKNSTFLLFGGPPCQGFSKANTKTRSLDNPNNWMFKEYLKFVSALQPEWFVFENVEGFRSFDKGNFSKDVEKELQDLGYTTNSSVLNAHNYGVPQSRQRFFIIGHRNNLGGIRFDFNDIPLVAPVTVKEALADLPKLSNGEMSDFSKYRKIKYISKYSELMRRKSNHPQQNYVSRNQEHIIERYKVIKQGENWKAALKKGLLTTYSSTKNTHGGIYRRLKLNEPSITISNYRKSMLIHPTEHRGLSLREAARLQSFPDNFIFTGGLDSMQQQLGNAVPPLLAKAIFEQIKTYSTDKIRDVA